MTTLRFANFVGPKVRTPLTSYFALPVVPTVLGFDPRLQFVHERDGLEVLWRTTLGDHGGTFNIAGDGVMMLSQAIRRAGRPSLPLPAAGGSLDRAGAAPARGGRLLPRADAVPVLRAGRRHHAGCGTCSVSRPATPPGRPSTTSSSARACAGRLSPDVVGAVETKVVDVLDTVASRTGSRA